MGRKCCREKQMTWIMGVAGVILMARVAFATSTAQEKCMLIARSKGGRAGDFCHLPT